MTSNYKKLECICDYWQYTGMNSQPISDVIRLPKNACEVHYPKKAVKECEDCRNSTGKYCSNHVDEQMRKAIDEMNYGKVLQPTFPEVKDTQEPWEKEFDDKFVGIRGVDNTEQFLLNDDIRITPKMVKQFIRNLLNEKIKKVEKRKLTWIKGQNIYEVENGVNITIINAEIDKIVEILKK